MLIEGSMSDVLLGSGPHEVDQVSDRLKAAIVLSSGYMLGQEKLTPGLSLLKGIEPPPLTDRSDVGARRSGRLGVP